jgi:hypothetical protein
MLFELETMEPLAAIRATSARSVSSQEAETVFAPFSSGRDQGDAMQISGEGARGSARTFSLPLKALGLPALLLLLSVPLRAQSDVPAASVTPNGTAQSAAQPTLREMIEKRENERNQSAVELMRARSLPQTLNLSQGQAVALDDIYSGFAMRRVEQEGKIVKWQSDLQKAQSPTDFNERRAAGLLQSIADAQRVISDNFIAARGKAIKVLTPAQRLQLQTIATASTANEPSSVGIVDARPSGPAPAQDAYFQLLLMPAADILQTPVDTQTVRRQYDRNNYAYSNRGRTSVFGSFGVFGGHSYSGIGIGGLGFGLGYGLGGFGHHRHRGRGFRHY